MSTSSTQYIIYSVYPYNESTKISNDGIITINLPSEQKYREDSFGIGANTMIAISEDNQLLFKNLCGYLIIKLYGDDITVKSLTLEGNNDEALSGEAEVTAVMNEVPEITFAEVAIKGITLTCETPVKIGTTPETATSFWLVVPPTVFDKGFTLKVFDSKKGVFEKATSSQFKISRNAIARMAALHVENMTPSVPVTGITLNKKELFLPTGRDEVLIATILPEDATDKSVAWSSSSSSIATVTSEGKVTAIKEGTAIIIAQAGDYSATCKVTVADDNSLIKFADPIAKYACVEKFDTNKDGEVSYAEAAAATSLSGLFTDWNTITEFDEIRFFTSITSTNNVFTGLSQLKHITIPDNITTLGTFQNCTALETVVLPAALNSIPTYCFDGCSSLKSVTLPTGITSVPNYAFRGCAALETLEVPSTITSVGQYAFSGCTVLTGIDMPSGFKTIGNYAFENCKAIVSADFPSSLTSIGQYAYSGCSKITSVVIGNGVSVGQRAFSSCTSLGSATIGSGVSLGSYAFSGCGSLVSVVLPEDMTSIPSYCFQNCTKLTTITWPSALTTIGNNAFEGCRFEDSDYALQLPSSVTSIGSNAFGYLHHLVLPSTTAISIASNSFVSGYTFLYVPDDKVDMYKVRTNWNNYADRIRPMSDYPVTSFTIGTVGEAVDLGLSVKWASWNVGASSPEGYGAYFAWGETDMKWDYDWSTYKWCNGSSTTLTKYCPTNKADYWDGAGTPDGKTVLDLEDDAARANWGCTWRMPTDAEWTELRNNCTWTWTTQNGVNGRLVTSNSNGNSIFLPAAGYRGGTDLFYAGSSGYYWSSSLYTVGPSDAWSVYFYSSSVYGYSIDRRYGLSVRPVLGNTTPEPPVTTNTIYYGFGNSAQYVYENGLKKENATSAMGRYKATNTSNEIYYFNILIPASMTQPEEFTMGGAPVGFDKYNVTISGKNFIHYRTYDQYESDVELSILAQA